jgi:hypothetical protein
VREELRQLSEAGLLVQSQQGKQVVYSANSKHPLFPELRSMVHKSLGMDRILESIVDRLGNLELAILLDDYAQGRDSGLIDPLLIGNIDHANLADRFRKTEQYIKRKVRTLVLAPEEYRMLKPTLDKRPQLLLWKRLESGPMPEAPGTSSTYFIPWKRRRPGHSGRRHVLDFGHFS